MQYCTQSFHKGTVIFKEGSSANKAYLVKSGSVSIYKIIGNHKVVLVKLKPGQVFGEMAVITGESRSASAIADENSELIVIDQENLEKALNESSPIIKAITKFLMTRLQDVSEKISSRSVNNVFLGVCNVIDLVYATFEQATKFGATKNQNELGIPYVELSSRIKIILSVSQLDIDNIVRKLKNINLVQINTQRNDLYENPGMNLKKDTKQFLKLIDPLIFMKIATQFYEEHQDTMNFGIQEQELIDIHEFATLLDTTPELIYKKIAAQEVPENIFFLKRRDSMHWANEMGASYFKKMKRPS